MQTAVDALEAHPGFTAITKKENTLLILPDLLRLLTSFHNHDESQKLYDAVAAAVVVAAVPVVPVTALTAVVPVTVMVWLSRLRSHDASLAPPRAHRTSQRRSPLLRLCQYLRFLPAEQKEQQH